MARPKRQDVRRASLVAAAQRTIIKHGADGAILNRIAAEAQVAPQTVSYYYPDLSGLIIDAIRHAMDRFYNERATTVREYSGPVAEQFRLMVSLGLPASPDDPEVRLLCEMGGASARYPIIAALLSTLFDREVSIYRSILDRGVNEGVFTLTASPEEISRNLVSLEDAYGYRLIGHHPTISRAHALELIYGYARQSLGNPLTPASAEQPQLVLPNTASSLAARPAP